MDKKKLASVPIIVPNRRGYSYRSRSGSAFTAVALALVILGLLFFLMFRMFDINRFYFPPLISMSMSETYKKTKEQYLISYNSQPQRHDQPQKQTQQYNPYVIRKSIQKEPEELIYKEITREIPVVSTTNYCRFCGAKVDREAIFCHQCGINLSS